MYIKGLQGFEWLNAYLVSAIDLWVMEQDIKIKRIYEHYGEPDVLIDGTPLSKADPDADFSRLPIVYDDD